MNEYKDYIDFKLIPIGSAYRITPRGGVYLKVNEDHGILIKGDGSTYYLGNKIWECEGMTAKLIKSVKFP